MSEGPPRGGKLAYLAPNAVTIGGLVVAWLSITRCLMGDPIAAAWIGLWAVFTDRLDGALARALRAQSAFGMQLDSLADLAAFGIAPAVLTFTFFSGRSGWGLLPLGAAACGYVVCAAARLARFNVHAAPGGTHEYTGFPTTMTAGFVNTFVLAVASRTPPPAVARFLPLVIVACAIGMIAPIRVPRLERPKSAVLAVGLAAIVVGGVTLTALRRVPEFGLVTIGAWYLFSVVHHVRTGA